MKKGKDTRFKKGHTPWHKGRTSVYTSEQLKRMGAAKKGKPAWNKGISPSKEQIEKQKESFKKTLLSNPEIRKRMSEVKKGKKPWITGRKHSNESLKRMSLAHKGQIAWNKGIALSEESKRKISESTKRGMSNPELRNRLNLNLVYTPLRQR